jgi:hypothetical protein
MVNTTHNQQITHQLPDPMMATFSLPGMLLYNLLLTSDLTALLAMNEMMGCGVLMTM